MLDVHVYMFLVSNQWSYLKSDSVSYELFRGSADPFSNLPPVMFHCMCWSNHGTDSFGDNKTFYFKRVMMWDPRTYCEPSW